MHKLFYSHSLVERISKEGNTKMKIVKEPIAIIGMSCRFPGGGNSPDEFWQNLVDGKDTIVPIPKERWDVRKFYDPDPDKPGKMYMREGGFLETDIKQFDALFFGISKREAQVLDPQQRICLELVVEAADDAGIPLEALSNTDTGVFMGGFFIDHLMLHMHYLNRQEIGTSSATAVSCTLLSNRLSYNLNLKGPSISMDTACSSSLVATHYACNSLWNGECHLAIAGGVNLMLNPATAITLAKGRFLSTHGRSMSFDSRGDGYGRGEGAGIVYLKRLSEAEADGDKIYAVIKNTGVNQDGRTPGITLPNPDSQKNLIEKVYKEAEITPSDIQYFEAHGTGTHAGDSTELTVLNALMKSNDLSNSSDVIKSSEKKFVGSVKSHIGHLEAASGIAGLIKTTLSVNKGVIPQNLHFENGNADVDFDEIALKVPVKNEQWPDCEVRRASINSFGFGGTNAHVVVESYQRNGSTKSELEKSFPPESRNRTISNKILLPLSARSETALKELAAQLADRIESRDDFNDIYFTLCYRRTHHSKRLAVLAESKHDLVDKLREFSKGGLSPDLIEGELEDETKLAFVYTGMGPQWWAMGRELFEREVIFRSAIEECNQIFQAISGWSLIEELSRSEDKSKISDTHITQPTNFAIQYALTKYWESLGIQPDYIVGHSLGEVAAAHAAGALNLEDALKTIYHRGRLQQSTDGQGGMLAVALNEIEIKPFLEPFEKRLCIAARNSPESVTLSGKSDAIEEISLLLEEQGIFHRPLHVKTGFHSFIMDGLKDELLASLNEIKPCTESKPLYSSVTGRREKGTFFDADYWWNNVRQPVMFADAVSALTSAGARLFLEIGPHPVLATSIKQCLQVNHARGDVFSSLVRKEPEQQNILRTLGKLYCAGYGIDWTIFRKTSGSFTDLPGYPWQKELCWLEGDYAREERVGNDEHPIFALDLRLPHPAWEVDFNLNYFPWLKDHVVENHILNPGAGYVEFGLVLSKKVFGKTACILQDIQFKNPLILREHDTQKLQVHYYPETGRFAIFSQNDQSIHSWNFHAGGELQPLDHIDNEGHIDLGEIKRVCNKSQDVREFYQMLAEVGLVYGETFQGIEEMHLGDGEVLVRVCTAETLLDDTCILHPCQLDACFQALASVRLDAQRPYLPIAIEQFVIYDSPSTEFWCHLKVTSQTERELRASFDIISPQGELLVQVRDVVCREVPALETIAHEYSDCLYRPQWEETSSRPDGIAAKNTILFLRADQVAIAQAWESADEKCVLVYWSEDFEVLDEAHKYLLNPRNRSHWERLWQSLRGFQFSSLIYIWHLAQEGMSVEHYENGDIWLNSLFTLPKEEILRRPFKIGLAVDNANFVVESDRCEGIGLSTLWGVSRVLASEIVTKWCKRVDFDSVSLENTQVLLDEFLLDDSEPEVAYRNGHRYVNRLQRVSEESLQGKSLITERTLESNITYSLKDSAFLEKLPFDVGDKEVKIRVHSYFISETLAESFDITQGKTNWEGWGEIVAVGDSEKGSHKVGDKVSFIGFDKELSTYCVTNTKWMMKCNSLSNWAPLSLLLPAISALNVLDESRDYEILLIGRKNPKIKLLESVLKSKGLNFDLLQLPLVPHSVQKEYDVVINCSGSDFNYSISSQIKPFGIYIALNESTSYNNLLWKKLTLRNVRIISAGISGLRQNGAEEELELAKSASRKFSTDFIEMNQFRRYTCDDLPKIFNALTHNTAIDAGILNFSQADNVKTIVPHKENTLFRKNATYLITGGTRGLGLEIAKWAVTQGTKNLVLLSLRGLTSQYAIEAVEKMEEEGCHVEVLALDIANKQELFGEWDRVKKNLPPLRGIFHGAMVLDDDFIQTLTPDRMDKVLSPKVKGAWNLHFLSLKEPLDYFFCFSSVSSLIGNPGQANYVAANYFLDIFAHYRRALNLPATTINLGVIADSGVVAEKKDVKEFFENAGFKGIKPDDVNRFLKFIHQTSPAQIGYFHLDWSKWITMLPTDSIPPFFENLMKDARGGSSGALMETLEKIIELSEDEKREFFLDIIKTELSQLLQIAYDKISNHTRIIDIGVNSLMVVELSGTMGQKYGCVMPILDIMSGATVEQAALIILRLVET